MDNGVLSREEIEEIADQLLIVFRDREMSARDAVRIMMVISIESCIKAAPTLSVALAELTKLFVQGLAPNVEAAMRAELDAIEDLYNKEGGEDEEI